LGHKCVYSLGAAEGIEREAAGTQVGRLGGRKEGRKDPVGEGEEEVFIAEISIAGSNALAQEGFRGFGFAIRGFAKGRTAA
jgi:hypothetical protein